MESLSPFGMEQVSCEQQMRKYVDGSSRCPSRYGIILPVDVRRDGWMRELYKYMSVDVSEYIRKKTVYFVPPGMAKWSTQMICLILW